MQHLGAPAVLPVYLEAPGLLVVAVGFQQTRPLEDVGVVPALLHLLACRYLPVAFLSGDAFALLVCDTAAAYPCLVPADEELAADLLAVGVDGEAVVVSFEEDCPLGADAVALLDVVGFVRDDAGVDELRGVVIGRGPRDVGRGDVEVAGQELAVELECVASAGARGEARQFLHPARDSRAAHIEVGLSH